MSGHSKQTDPPVRFAVIGCGMLAQATHLPNLAASNKTALQLCCDVEPGILDMCRTKWNVPHVTDDFAEAVNHPEVDAICLATTPRIRKEVIALAAAAGKPVYTEKPLATDLREAYDIREIVRDSGIPLCVGHNRRSSPAMLDAHRIFRRHMTDPQPCPWRFDREGPDHRPKVDGDGAPQFTCRINDDWYSWKGRAFEANQFSHGRLLHEMTHFVDLANWFFEATPVEAVALEPNQLNHAAIITYDNGAVATISMSGNGTFDYPKELYELTGNAGFIAIDHMLEVRTAGISDAPRVQRYEIRHDFFPDVGVEGGLHGFLAKQRAAEQRAEAEGVDAFRYAPFSDKGHARQLDRFADEIRGRGPVVCGVDDAILATETCFAAVRAAKMKRAVTLADVRRAQRAGVA